MLGVVVSSGSFFKVTYAPFLTTRLLQQKVCIFNFEGCSKFLDIVSTGESLGTFFLHHVTLLFIMSDAYIMQRRCQDPSIHPRWRG